MSGSIVREALVRVTVWGLQDRLADWLPGQGPPSRAGTDRTDEHGRDSGARDGA